MELIVSSPCPKTWEELVGNDRVRFCGQCHLNVYNLTIMKPAEIEQLVHHWLPEPGTAEHQRLAAMGSDGGEVGRSGGVSPSPGRRRHQLRPSNAGPAGVESRDLRVYGWALNLSFAFTGFLESFRTTTDHWPVLNSPEAEYSSPFFAVS